MQEVKHPQEQMVHLELEALQQLVEIIINMVQPEVAEAGTVEGQVPHLVMVQIMILIQVEVQVMSILHQLQQIIHQEIY